MVKSIQLIDMYGAPIQFTYKGKSMFSTYCSVIVSVIVIILLIIYAIFVILDMTTMIKPIILENIQLYSNAPYYNITPDYPSLFGGKDSIKISIPEDKINTSASVQFSFGFIDIQTENNLPIDPSYFMMEITHSSHNGSIVNDKPLYYDLCTRFPNIPAETNDYNYINRTYCLYSLFDTHNDELNYDMSKVNINFKICKNNTYVNIKKEDMKSYIELKNMYLHLAFVNDINITENENNNNDDSFSSINPHVQKSDDINVEYIKCKSLDEIIKFIHNTKLTIYSENQIVNTTDKSGIMPYFSFQDIYFTTNVKKKVKVYLQLDVLNSHENFLPSSMSNASHVKYIMRVPNNLIQTTYSDFNVKTSTDLNFMQISILSSPLKITIERTFKNIFDLLGIIGGMGKILIIIGFFFAFSVTKHKLQENLINEFYSVIDPNKLEEVSKKFDDYIEERALKLNLIAQHKEDSQRDFLEDKKDKIINLEKIASNDPEKPESYKFENKIEKSNERMTVLEEYFDAVTIKSILEVNENNKKTKREISILNNEKLKYENDSKEYYDVMKQIEEKENDLQAFHKKKYEILYEVFKHRTHKNLNYTVFEFLQNIFCFCCLTRYMKRKNKTYHLAAKHLEDDTDFKTVIKSIQEFANLKKALLEEGQQYLFNSITNPEITHIFVRQQEEDIKRKKQKTKELKSILNKKEKNAANNYKNSLKILGLNESSPVDKFINNDEDFKNMKKLEDSLISLHNVDRVLDETDLKLLNHLVEDKNLVKEFIGNREINKFNIKDDNIAFTGRQNEDMNDRDLNEINKKFYKK